MQYPFLSPGDIESLARIRQKTLGETDPNHNWEGDLRSLYGLGFGLQEVFQYLYSQRPDLPVFLQWINDRVVVSAADDAAAADVLSPADLQHWREHGFVVIKEAVTREEYEAANAAIWEFLGADSTEPESWYRQHPAKNGLMLVFTQHEALRKIRDSKKARKAFEQLYGSTEIYKVVDKLSFNPPETDQYKFQGSRLHWDTSLELPVPDKFQGLIYLTDVMSDSGAFQCVPGFHRNIDQWLGDLPAGVDPREYASKNLKPVPITGNAGDLIIWHQALPHCASPNRGKLPRLVQYLTYTPDNFEDHRPWK